MAEEGIRIPFPVKGLVENYAFEEQPSGTTVDCENVRAYDPTTGRSRGGQRAGTKNVLSSAIAAGDIQAISSVTYNPAQSNTPGTTLETPGNLVFEDIAFKTDGTKLYILGSDATLVEQYTITAWDVSTGSADSKTFDVSSEEGTPTGLFFRDNGSKMFIVGRAQSKVFQYTLDTAWDVSTAVYDSVSLDVSGQVSTIDGIFIGSSGLRMYLVSGSTVYQYSMITPWDLNTADYDNVSLSVGSTSYGLYFEDDGTTMFVARSTSVAQYALSTGWALSTATALGSINVNEDDSIRGIAFQSDGTTFYLVGSENARIYEYESNAAWNLTGFSTSGTTAVSTFAFGVDDVFFDASGLRMYVVSSGDAAVYQYDLTLAWDVSTASYTELSKSVSAEDTAPTGVYFKSDGLVMWIVGDTNNTVYQYTLSTAWDVSSASYASLSFSVATQTTSPSGIWIQSDGSKMFVSGTAGGLGAGIYRYSLSPVWTFSTPPSYDTNTLAVAGAHDIYIKGNNGRQIYVLKDDGLTYYNMSTGFDLSTATEFTDIKIGNAQTYRGLSFKDDGGAFFIAGGTTESIYGYTLENNWDISLYESKSLDVSPDDTDPEGLTWGDSGNSLYVIGNQNNRVYRYTCSTAYSVNTASLDSNANTTASGHGGIAWSDDGLQMFFTETGGTTVQQWTSTLPWVFGLPNKSKDISGQTSTAADLAFGDSGKKLYIIDATKVYQYNLSSAFNIDTATYVSGNDLSIAAAQDTAATGVAISSDGLKLFVVGTSNDKVHEYTLTTAWDLSTAIYSNYSYDVSEEDGTPTGITFKSDGSKFYISGTGNDGVFQYDTRNNWSTAVHTVLTTLPLDLSTPLRSDITFKTDGAKVYVVSAGSGIIDEYNLTTPWLASTISASINSLNVRSEDINPSGAFLKATDGTEIYVLGKTNASVYQYHLSSGWDLSSAGAVTDTFSVAAQDGSPEGIFIGDSGTKMYILGGSGNRVYQYTLSVAWELSTAPTYANKAISLAAVETSATGIYFEDDGTTMFIIGQATGAVHRYTLSVGWDVSTATYDGQAIDVSAEETAPTGVGFHSDGSKMFTIGTVGTKLYEYGLSSVWDLIDFTDEFTDIVETVPTGIAFSADGLVLYVVGSDTAKVRQYDLTTAFDTQTATYDDLFDLSTEGTNPQAVSVNAAGTRLFILDGTNASIQQYTISSGDVATASVDAADVLDVSGDDIAPTGMVFGSSGTKIYVTGPTTTATVYEYTTTADDLSTATATGESKVVSAEDTSPQAIALNTDGTKMFVLGSQNNRAYEYALGTAYDLSGTVTYSNANHFVGGQDTSPTGLAFNAVGDRMFMIGTVTAQVWQYSVIAFDFTAFRLRSILAVHEGDIYRVESGTALLAGGGSDALDDTLNVYVYGQEFFGSVYFVDGTNYVVHNAAGDTTLTWTATAGTLPVNSTATARLIALYRGRLVLSGVVGDDHNWFMSAAGNALDFDYSPSTVTQTQATSGNNSPAGLVGDVITALIPVTDDLLLFGCDHSIWRMTGDPMAGGQIDLVSDITGMSFGRAWCKDPSGRVYFFGRRGGVFYTNGSEVKRISSQAIEERLAVIDLSDHRVVMVWNDRFIGLDVFISPNVAASSTTHYFYDVRNESWWPVAFTDTDHNPLVAVLMDGDDIDDRAVWMGGRDGQIRSWDATADDDNGTAISSYVVLGPIGATDRESIITELSCVLSQNSDTVLYSVLEGNYAEVASAASASFSGSFTAGRSTFHYPRTKGYSQYVKLENSTLNTAWAIEEIRARLAPAGRRTF
jgi:sugar lactone lactonase YvrE